MMYRKTFFARYTQPLHLLFLLFLLSSLFAACSPGHNGKNIIAFVRSGELWTIDPNGANAFKIVANNPAVSDFAWSPTHQLLTYRTLNPDFANSNEGQQVQAHALMGSVGDVPATLNTLGIDGGTPIPIAFSNRELRSSLPSWNNNGSRLLYRTTLLEAPQDFHAINWYLSQNDQPAEIALKSLPASFSIPSLSYQSTNYRVLGNDEQGIFTSSFTGDQIKHLPQTALPGHPLPASLERILWRPAHADQEMLYAVTVPTFAPQQPDQMVVQLILRTLAGKETRLITCQCKQFAWSPDGRFVLARTSDGYSLLNVDQHTSWDIPFTERSVPYWSPDGQFLLLDGDHTLQLISPIHKQQQILLSDGKNDQSTDTLTLPAQTALLQSAPNSPWASDSRHLLFLTHDRLQWQGQQLSSGVGLYTVEIDEKGHPQGQPGLVAQGNITQVGWSYQDANTSFLY